MDTPQERIRVAFIGLSAHADEHLLPAIQQLPQFCLSHVVSRNYSKARHFQQRFSATYIATDWRKLLVSSTELDAVLVTGPPLFHEEVLTACLPRKIAVFVEKPCARSLSRLRLLVDCANANEDTPTVVGYNFRYADSFRLLMRKAEESGGVRDLTIRFLTNKPVEPLWDYTSTFESFIYAVAIHAIDLAISIIGVPKTVTSTYISLGNSLFRMEVNMVGQCGIPAKLYLGNCVQHFTAEYEVVTQCGVAIRCSPTELKPCEAHPGSRGQAAPKCMPLPNLTKTMHYGYMRELELFAQVVAGSLRSPSSIQQSLSVYEVIDSLLAQHSRR